MKKLLWSVVALLVGLVAIVWSMPDPTVMRRFGTLPVPQLPGLRVVLEQDQEFESSNNVYCRVVDATGRTVHGPDFLFGSAEWEKDALDFRAVAYDSVLVLTYDSLHTQDDSPADVVALYNLRAPADTVGPSGFRDPQRRADLLNRVQAHDPQLRWAVFRP